MATNSNNIMSQQQQSNPIKPQKIGKKKNPFASMNVKKGTPLSKKGMAMKGMDAIRPVKKAKKSMPSMAKVQKSVAKTMGY